jgi:hypothetical protein
MNGKDEKCVQNFSWKPEGQLGDLDVGGRIILKWTLKIQNVKLWTRFFWLRIETSARFL